MRGDTRIEIGGVARAHGIRGEIVVVTHDPDSETLGNVESIYIGGVERKITQARATQRGWLIALDGVTTRNEAETFQGQRVEVDRDVLDLDEDDVILDDLVGCAVRLADGTPWGTVHAIEPGAYQDLLIIHTDTHERLLPLVDEFVKSIDVDEGIIVVDPPDGLPEMALPRKQ